jgi:general secretion pathway protein M
MERTARERALLRIGAVVAIAALVWMHGLRPALNTIAQSRELLPRLHADAAQVDALILEAQSLQRRQSGTIDGNELSQALHASLRRAGLEEAVTLSETGPSSGSAPRQWEITLSNASAAPVLEWLASLPYLLQLRIQTVELARATVDGRDTPGHVSGRIAVHQPAKSNP